MTEDGPMITRKDIVAINSVMSLLDMVFCCGWGGGYIEASTTTLTCAECGHKQDYRGWWQWGGAPFMCDECNSGWTKSDNQNEHEPNIDPMEAIKHLTELKKRLIPEDIGSESR